MEKGPFEGTKLGPWAALRHWHTRNHPHLHSLQQLQLQQQQQLLLQLLLLLPPVTT